MIRSPTNLKDPTMSKTLREVYASKLRRLFRNYRTELLKRFDDSRNLEISDINIPEMDISLSSMNAYMESTTKDYITTPAAILIAERLEKTYRAGVTWANLRVFKTDSQLMPVDWRAIDALKVRNLTALNKITAEMNGQIIRIISDGMIRGDHPRVIAKAIAERVDAIGIVRANMMARTETITAFNRAAEIRYSQYGYEKLEWLTAIDGRECETCRGYNGEVFDVTSNHERPPAHVNCRCTILPVE